MRYFQLCICKVAKTHRIINATITTGVISTTHSHKTRPLSNAVITFLFTHDHFTEKSKECVDGYTDWRARVVLCQCCFLHWLQLKFWEEIHWAIRLFRVKGEVMPTRASLNSAQWHSEVTTDERTVSALSCELANSECEAEMTLSRSLF